MFKFLLFLSSIAVTIFSTNGQNNGIHYPTLELILNSWKSLNSNETNDKSSVGFSTNGQINEIRTVVPLLDPLKPLNFNKKNEESSVDSLQSDIIISYEPDVDVYTMDDPTSSEHENEFTTDNSDKNMTNMYYSLIDENKSNNIHSNENKNNNKNKTIHMENEMNLLLKYPSKVSLHYINDYTGNIKSYICAGVLISKTKILTSSFCFDNYTIPDDEILPENLKISFNADTLRSEEWKLKLHSVDKIIVNSTIELAILQIPEINISSTVNHGFLPKSPTKIGDRVNILQYRHLRDTNIDEELKEGVISILNSTVLNFFTNETANSNYYGHYESLENGLCNVQIGDPVYEDKNIVGVMQYPHDCHDNYFLIFTNVSNHINWIENY